MYSNSKLMTDQNEENSKSLIIKNELGLHARPAAFIAKLAQGAESKIWIIKDQDKVDAASIIDILTLACLKGSEITLMIENESDRNILKDIVELIESGFGE